MSSWMVLWPQVQKPVNVLSRKVIALLLFIFAIILCILSGVKAFLANGCEQIYILNDPTVCGGSLEVVRQFLSTFWKDLAESLVETCSTQNLLACQTIGKRLKTSTTYVIIGSVLAAIFTFQLIVESAVLHEHARWAKMHDDEAPGENK